MIGRKSDEHVVLVSARFVPMPAFGRALSAGRTPVIPVRLWRGLRGRSRAEIAEGERARGEERPGCAARVTAEVVADAVVVREGEFRVPSLEASFDMVLVLTL